jgi:hypothetical protein
MGIIPYQERKSRFQPHFHIKKERAQGGETDAVSQKTKRFRFSERVGENTS